MLFESGCDIFTVTETNLKNKQNLITGKPGLDKIGLLGIVRDRTSYQKFSGNIIYNKTKGRI